MVIVKIDKKKKRKKEEDIWGVISSEKLTKKLPFLRTGEGLQERARDREMAMDQNSNIIAYFSKNVGVYKPVSYYRKVKS